MNLKNNELGYNKLNNNQNNGSYDDSIIKENIRKINSELENIENELELRNSVNIKQFGAKCDGFNDDTNALKEALLSNYSVIIIPSGTTYISTGNIEVTNTIPKKIVGHGNSIIKCDFDSAKGLINTTVDISMDNIKFDFSNKSCTYALYSKNGVTNTEITNCIFENVRDLNNTSTCIINVGFGKLFIDNVTIQNCYKLDNKTVGDGGGNLAGILYTAKDNYHACIKNINIDTMFSIDSEDGIAHDDVSCIYITSDSKKGQCVIENIKAYNFGRRLIKTQANNVYINGLYAKCDKATVLAVVGFNDADAPLSRSNVSINNFVIEGKCSYAIVTSIGDTIIENGVINIEDTSKAVVDVKATALMLKGPKLTVRNVNIKSNNTAFICGGNAYNTKDILIENCIFDRTGDYGIVFMESNINTFTVMNNITIKDCVFKDDDRVSELSINGNCLSEGTSNIRLVNNKFEIYDSGSNTPSRNQSPIYLCNAERVYIDNTQVIPRDIDKIFEGIKLVNCKNVNISNLSCNQKVEPGESACRVLNIQKSSDIIVDGVTSKNMKMLAFNTCENVLVSSIDYSILININSTIFTKTKLGLGMSTRPTSDLYVGYCHYDKGLNKPIWWTGTNWVDANGTTVS